MTRNSIGVPTAKTRRTLRLLGLYTEDTILYDQSLRLRRMIRREALLHAIHLDRVLRRPETIEQRHFKRGDR